MCVMLSIMCFSWYFTFTMNISLYCCAFKKAILYLLQEVILITRKKCVYSHEKWKRWCYYWGLNILIIFVNNLLQLRVCVNMTRSNNYRPTTVQFEPKKQQYGKTKLTKSDSTEAIDMGPMTSECRLMRRWYVN